MRRFVEIIIVPVLLWLALSLQALAAPLPMGAPKTAAPAAATQLTAAPAQTAAPAKPAALPSKKFRVLLSFRNGIGFFPVPIAEELGYLRAEGFDMDLQVVNGSSALIQQLAGGNADLGVPLAPNALLGFAEGVKMTVFYDWMSKNSFDVWVRADSPFNKLADLKSKTIGVSDMTRGGTPMLRATFQKAGLNPLHGVSIVALGLGRPLQAQALKDKRVDAFYVPWSGYAHISTVLEADGIKLRCLSCDLQELRLASEVWAARTEVFKRDRAYLAGFGRALAKASLFTETNLDAALAILKKAHPWEHTDAVIPKKLLIDMLSSKGRPRQGGKYGYADLRSWDLLQEFMLTPAAAGATGLQTKVDITQLVTNDLVEEMNRFDAEAVKKQAREWKP